MSENLGSVYAEIRLKLDSLRQDIAEANQLLGSFGKDVKIDEKDVTPEGFNLAQFGASLSSVGTSLSKYVTAPLVLMGGVSTKAATDFETGMAMVRKTTNMSETELAAMGDAIRDMAKEVPISVIQLTEFAETAGQLGIDPDNILGFSRVMADLGVSTNIVGQEGAIAMAQFANITKMPQTEFDRLGSVIVDLGNNMATTERPILEMGHRLAAAGSLAGMSEADILGVSAALSSLGMEAASGGSAFSRVINRLQLAVDTGSEDLWDFAKVAGMTASDFSEAWEKDAAGALSAFIVGLGDAEAKGISTNEMLEDLGIKNLIVGDALRRASGNSELFTNALEMANDAWNDNLALSTEAGILYGTTSSQMALARQKINDAAITIGENLLPVVANIAGWLAKLAEAFGNLSPTTQTAIIGLLGVAAAIGPILKIAGGAITGVQKLGKAFSGLGTVGAAGVGAAGIAAVVAATALLVTECFKGSAAVEELIKSIKNSSTEFENNYKAIDTNYGVIDTLKTRLYELAGQTNRTTAEQREMDAIIKQLNEKLPELNLYLDEETGALNMTKAAMEDYIEASKKRVELEALDERRLELMKEEIEITQGIADATKVLEDVKPWEFWKTFPWGSGLKAANDLRKLTKEEENNASAVEWLNEKYVELAGTLDGSSSSATEWFEGVINGSLALSEAHKELVDSVMNGTMTIDEAYQAMMDSATESNEEIAESAEDRAAREEEAARLSKEAAEELAKAITDKTDEIYSAMGGMGQGLIEKTELTADQVKANLEAQIADWTAWQQELAKIQGRVPEVMFEELAKMGPEALPLLEEFNNMTSDELDEFVDLFAEKMRLSKQGALLELGLLPEGIAEKLTEAENVIDGKKDDFREKGADLGKAEVEGYILANSERIAAVTSGADDALLALEDKHADFRDKGYNSGLGYAEGYTEAQGVQVSAGTSGADAALLALQDKHADFRDKGLAGGSAYADGIAEKSTDSSTSSNALAQAAVDAAKSTQIISAWRTAGVNSVQSYILGIQFKVNAVGDVGRRMADTAKNAAASISLYQTGVNAAQSFINGMSAYNTAAYNAGYNLGSSALAGSRAALAISSPSKAAQEDARNFAYSFINQLKKLESEMYLVSRELAAQTTEGFSGGMEEALTEKLRMLERKTQRTLREMSDGLSSGMGDGFADELRMLERKIQKTTRDISDRLAEGLTGGLGSMRGVETSFAEELKMLELKINKTTRDMTDKVAREFTDGFERIQNIDITNKLVSSVQDTQEVPQMLNAVVMKLQELPQMLREVVLRIQEFPHMLKQFVLETELVEKHLVSILARVQNIPPQLKSTIASIKTDLAYIDSLMGSDSTALYESTFRGVSNAVVEHDHTGTLTIKGVDNRGQVVEVVQIVMDELRREVRT